MLEVTLKEKNLHDWQKRKRNYKGSCHFDRWGITAGPIKVQGAASAPQRRKWRHYTETFHFVGWFKQSYTKLHESYYFVNSCTSIPFFFPIPDIKFSVDFIHISSVSVRSRKTLALIVSEWIPSFTVANMAISQRQNNLCTMATSSYVLLPQFMCVLLRHPPVSLRPILAKIFSKSKRVAKLCGRRN